MSNLIGIVFIAVYINIFYFSYTMLFKMSIFYQHIACHSLIQHFAMTFQMIYSQKKYSFSLNLEYNRRIYSVNHNSIK